MKIKPLTLLNVVLVICLVTALLFASGAITGGGGGEYDPWLDTNDDGKIRIDDVLAVALAFGADGTALTKASITYDSGWLNITGYEGQNYTIVYGVSLNTTDICVDARMLVRGWNQTYGGIGEDSARCVVQTSDGGYAIAGKTNSSGAGWYDFWLVKTDPSGNMQWNRTYGGVDPDRAFSVVQTSDGGYAIAGETNSSGAGGYDFWLVKTDPSGNMQWNRTYGGTDWDSAHSMVQTVDGGYAIAGTTDSFGAGSDDFWLVKTDVAGNVQWNQTYGGTDYDLAHSVVQTSDGGYAIAGYTRSFGAGWMDCWLIKTDSDGNMVWSKTLGGGNSDDYAYSMVQLRGEGYAIAGTTYNVSDPSEGWNVLLIETDADGTMLWKRTYGGLGLDEAYSIIQTSDGGYAIAGETSSSGAGGYDFWLIKTDVEYGLAWTDSTANSITLVKRATDPSWNYVRVRIWKIRETP